MNTSSPTELRRIYWLRNRQLTVALLLVWFLVTYLASYFADALNGVVILGFPLGFYMAAQGALIVYVLVVGCYALMMRRLEKKYGIEDQGG